MSKVYHLIIFNEAKLPELVSIHVHEHTQSVGYFYPLWLGALHNLDNDKE